MEFGESRWWLQVQRTVRSHLVVIVFPITCHDPCFTQSIEKFPVKAFSSQPAVKTLCIAILPGASWIDIDGLNAMLGEPSLDRSGNKLRPVVTSDVLRRSFLANDFF